MKVLVAGGHGQGKTRLILAFLAYHSQLDAHIANQYTMARTTNLPSSQWGVFKPFDTGLLASLQSDRLSDGELYAKLHQDHPHVSKINPYICYGPGPFAYGLEENFQNIDSQGLRNIGKSWEKIYSHLYIESLPYWCSPITHELDFVTWAKEQTQTAIWVVKPHRQELEKNICLIQQMRQNFTKCVVVINNHPTSWDQEWLTYFWQTIENKTQVPTLGLMPDLGSPFKVEGEIPRENKKLCNLIYKLHEQLRN